MTLDINTIYHGDCLELMKDIPDKSIDLVLTDPPYGISINNNMGRRKGDKPSDYKKCDWDKSRPDKIYFDEIQRISKNQIIFGGNYFADMLPPSSCWLVWDKGFSEDLSFAQIELVWSSFTSSSKKCKMSSSQKDRVHPTQKPIKLIEWCLNKYSDEGMTIFDPFLGSGTTAIACINTGRNFIGIEKDEDYFNLAQKRVKEAQGQKRLI